jgi:hypothetical protein
VSMLERYHAEEQAGMNSADERGIKRTTHTHSEPQTLPT